MGQLPQNIQVEVEILGGIMQNPNMLTEVLESVTFEDFYIKRHVVIFEGLCRLFAEGKDINITMLIDAIGRENLKDVGGVTYITELATSGLLINPEKYIEILKNCSYRRKAIKAMQKYMNKFYDDNENPNKLSGELINLLVDSSTVHSSILNDTKLLTLTVEEIEKRYKNGGQISGMETGFINFDRATNGLKKGELVVIGGRPSMGKTLMALNIGDKLAEKGYCVGLMELEMTPESLGFRRLAYNSNTETQKLQTGKLNDEEFYKVVAAFNRLAKNDKVFTDCSSYQSILTIKAKAKAIKQSHGLDCFIVDHLTLMDIPSKNNRSQEIGDVTRALKLLAKELDINVILVCQLSRAVELRSNKRPIMSDLRESGNIEQDADLIVFAYRDEYYYPDTEEKNIIEWIISKQRNGRTGTLKFRYLDKLQKIENL